MKTFTVHMPPPTGDPEEDALEAVFVREAFSIWAFLFPLVWLLVYRMWLVLIGYLVLTAILEGAALAVGGIAPGVVAVMIAILFGLEAGTLRRWTLRRNGYVFAGIAAGRDLADAEHRFFTAWTSAPRRPPASEAPPPRRLTPGTERPVAGLFPQPERSR